MVSIVDPMFYSMVNGSFVRPFVHVSFMWLWLFFLHTRMYVYVLIAFGYVCITIHDTSDDMPTIWCEIDDNDKRRLSNTNNSKQCLLFFYSIVWLFCWLSFYKLEPFANHGRKRNARQKKWMKRPFQTTLFLFVCSGPGYMVNNQYRDTDEK